MSTAVIDGITTRYEMLGSGPPLLLFSPGGFNSVLENWRTLGAYRSLNLLEHLPERYTCILFDRRESGESGGRIERVDWADYVAQGLGLLDHLEVERAHLMGGCVGCSTAIATAVMSPQRVAGMILFSPAGGPRYRMTSQSRFARHLAYVEEHGLDGVVALAESHDEGFSKDPRIGPWAPLVRQDPAFSATYRACDPARYTQIITGMSRLLFDRDTVPGAEPEDLLGLDTPTLIVPGEDTSHAPSAARYLQECLPHAEFWDTPVSERTEHNTPSRLLRFLDAAN